MSVLQKFVSAAKEIGLAANEWRDSIFYAVVTAATISDLSNGVGSESINNVLFWGVFREAGRSLAWGMEAPFIVVGLQDAPIDTRMRYRAALVVAGTLLVPFISLVSPYSTQLTSAVVPSLLVLYGGYKWQYGQTGSLRNLYFKKENGMWDWPRRNTGGGTTHSARIADFVKGSFKSLVLPLPVPSRRAVRSRVLPLRLTPPV